MTLHRLEHLDDATLRRDLHQHVTSEKGVTAVVLAHIAEFDSRRLYLAEAFPSMFAYCIGSLGYSEDAAYRRIRVARAAHCFPRLFDDVAEGRLQMAVICVLAPHLTAENADELTSAATRRTKAEVEAWIASRFAPTGDTLRVPRARVTPVRPVARARSEGKQVNQLVPGRVDFPMFDLPQVESVPEPIAPPSLFVAHIPMNEDTRAKLGRVKDLLAHAVPSGDLSEIFDRALDALLSKLETRKHGSVRRPGPAEPSERIAPAVAPRSRGIPAHVRRAVWERDGGRCTFVSESGHRCAARRGLEYDHVVPFARGGVSTVDGLRLRCRAHNQYEAEQAFGADFMRGKRAAARA